MSNKKIVVALGGNALGDTPEQQKSLVKNAASTIVDLVESGYNVIVGHGNGPQVGMINMAMSYAYENGANTPYMDFPECGAMSQGYIGYHLQQAISNELHVRKIDKTAVSLVTQVIVDENDDAFKNPTKPIGQFYKKEDVKKVFEDRGFDYVEDSGRGYRRVVPSPTPVKIVELSSINEMADKGFVVIAVGGGGIPVIESNGELRGIASVIDKDRSCAKLAIDTNADALLILTAVDKVCINFNKENQEELSNININQAKEYIQQGQFAKGSMLPKVQACMEYLNYKKEGKALITSLEKAKEALNGKTGTVITN